MTKHTEWASRLWNDLDEDDDSDTDSRLSGSVAVDSVMRRMQQQKRSYIPPGEDEGSGNRTNEFMLDPIIDHSTDQSDDTDGGGGGAVRRGGQPYVGVSANGGIRSNGYRSSQSPSQMRRGNFGGMSGLSPKPNNRSMGYVNVRLGSRDPGYYPGARRNDHLLSPVPENMIGRQFNSSASDVGVVMSGTRGWNHGTPPTNGPHHRSMEMVHHGGRNSPSLLGRSFDDGRALVDGYRSPHSHSSGSSEGLSRSTSEHTKLPPSGATVSRRSTIGPSPNPPSYPSYNIPNIGPGRSPQLPARFHHPTTTTSTIDTFRNPQNDSLEHQVSSMGHSQSASSPDTREPNLNDVIDFLSSSNPSNVINAASYLQHFAYNNDSMKAKIRQFGGIPALISQLRFHDNLQVQLALLGALRNLSYGRTNVENKMQIASDAGLPELSIALKSARHPDVRELVTSIFWNLSSCDDIKLRILQVCLKDLVECVIIPHSGYAYNSLAAKDFSVRPNVSQWSAEMRNTLGALRNISSAGEDTRKFLRVSPHLVDSLLWIVRAATGQEDTDEKTAENAMCILRNLSYRLEYEVDPLEGSQDHLDEAWERQVLAEIEDTKEEEDEPRRRSGSFLTICTRPRTADNLRRSVPRLAPPLNLVSPDPTLIPRRVHAVTGVSLLWQPEVVFPYLALIEKFASTPELVEAAAGAIQNLTACAWKWSVYGRYLVRKTRGLTLLIDLLNHSHDIVVRSAATALRNLAVDYPNKRMIGLHGIQHVIPRLPYGQNCLGISEPTTIALLCALMELTLKNPENARVFRENSGIPLLVKLTRSKDHTPRVIYAAQKLCSILNELKITKTSLKQEGWDIKEYQRLAADTSAQQIEFERGGFANTEIRRTSRGNDGKADRQGRKKSHDENMPPTERKISQPISQAPPTVSNNNLGPNPPQVRSLVIADTTEPGYQLIDIPKQKQSTSQVQIPPASIEPIGMYAEIGNQLPQPTSSRRGSEPMTPRSDSRTQSHSDTQSRSDPRSSPIEHQNNTQGSNGHSDEDLSKPGTALYAQVDMEKKRASRKQKQQTAPMYREEIFIGGQQHQPPSQTEDSWV